MSNTPDDADEDAPTDDELVDELADDQADDDPFAELEDVEVEEDPFDTWDDLDDPGGDDPFTEVAVGDVDESKIWEEIGAAQDDSTDVAVGGTLPDVDTDRGEEIVPKRSYCEKCQHFSAPPETSCANPGTEIRELVDMKHFRVANCPVAAKRRGLDYVPQADESADD